MMLVKLLKELSPTQIVIAFDKSRTTFRTALYPDYKGTRDKTPEELIAQIPLLKELAEALGISFLELDDYEADDIIGTLAVQAAAEGVETRVITGDRDALQLIRPQLTVLLTKKGISETKAYDTAIFEEEYGFPPIRLIDMKGLMGDSSTTFRACPVSARRRRQSFCSPMRASRTFSTMPQRSAGKSSVRRSWSIANRHCSPSSSPRSNVMCRSCTTMRRPSACSRIVLRSRHSVMPMSCARSGVLCRST